jgi:hypothetical protein
MMIVTKIVDQPVAVIPAQAGIQKPKALFEEEYLDCRVKPDNDK